LRIFLFKKRIVKRNIFLLITIVIYASFVCTIIATCIIRLTVFRFSVPTFGTDPKRQGTELLYIVYSVPTFGTDPSLGAKNSGFGSKNGQSMYYFAKKI